MKKSIDLTAATWVRSSRSNGGTNCVEVAFADGLVAIRDSKDPGGAALVFPPAAYTALLGGIRRGELDLS